MADNFLEYHREEYEKRKERWLGNKKKTNLIYNSQRKSNK
ncbi:MAG: dehydrogenase [Prevotellaceae bacterium]|nr:dehydrogenase [Prevotellaceae bacterium]MDO4932211.1 dehydrogenase [Prevotellaceae bacterium]